MTKSEMKNWIKKYQAIIDDPSVTPEKVYNILPDNFWMSREGKAFEILLFYKKFGPKVFMVRISNEGIGQLGVIKATGGFLLLTNLNLAYTLYKDLVFDSIKEILATILKGNELAYMVSDIVNNLPDLVE